MIYIIIMGTAVIILFIVALSIKVKSGNELCKTIDSMTNEQYFRWLSELSNNEMQDLVRWGALNMVDITRRKYDFMLEEIYRSSKFKTMESK